jgi:hypothetical protein
MKQPPIACVPVLLVVMVIGCAATRTWTSTPPVRTFENPVYDAALEPLKKNGIFLVVRHKGKELRKKLLLQIKLQETD